MATREKIREGLAECFYYFSEWDGVTKWEDVTEEIKEVCYDFVGASIPKLHSQGVVIKVDKELPKNPIKVTTHLGLSKEEANTRQLESDCFTQVIQDQMLKAGYEATMPLVEEV